MKNSLINAPEKTKIRFFSSPRQNSAPQKHGPPRAYATQARALGGTAPFFTTWTQPGAGFFVIIAEHVITASVSFLVNVRYADSLAMGASTVQANYGAAGRLAEASTEPLAG